MESPVEPDPLVAELPASDSARLAAGASVNLAGKAFSTPLRFITQVLLARWLGKEAYGLYSIGWVLLSMVQTIAPLGADRGVVRFLPAYWRRNASGVKGVVFESHSVALLAGLIMGAATFLAAPWLADGFFQKPSLVLVLRLFALAFPLQSLLVVATMASRATQSMKYATLSMEVVQPAANLVLAVALLVVGWGLLGGVVAGAVSVALAAVVALYYVWRLFPEAFARATPFQSKLKELLVFSLPAYGAGVFVLLVSRLDRLALGYFRTAAEVGIYQTVGQLPIFFEFVLTTFMQMMAPMIADLEHRHERVRLQSLYRVGTKWSFYLILPIFLVVCFAPREVMGVVFGAQYESGAAALVALAIGQFINVGTGATGPLLMMTGYERHWLALTAAVSAVDLVLLAWLVPLWGVLGAAAATAGALGILYVVGTLLVKRLLGIWPYDRRYFKGIIAMAATAGALWVLRWAVPLPPLFLLLSAGALSVLVFGGMLLALKLDPEDREFIQMVEARVARLLDKADRKA